MHFLSITRTTCKTTKFMEIYLSKKGFARKINNLTDFLLNKTEVSKNNYALKKKVPGLFQDFSSIFQFCRTVFTGLTWFPGLSRFFQDQWPPCTKWMIGIDLSRFKPSLNTSKILRNAIENTVSILISIAFKWKEIRVTKKCE